MKSIADETINHLFRVLDGEALADIADGAGITSQGLAYRISAVLKKRAPRYYAKNIAKGVTGKDLRPTIYQMRRDREEIIAEMNMLDRLSKGSKAPQPGMSEDLVIRVVSNGWVILPVNKGAANADSRMCVFAELNAMLDYIRSVMEVDA